MSEETERPPLSRQFRLDEIRDGASGTIEATEAEMAAICRLLELKGLEGLALTYRLSHTGAGRLRLKGELKADVTQTCVVSLEPVPSHLDVPVEAEFWPSDMIEAHEEREEEPEAPPSPTGPSRSRTAGSTLGRSSTRRLPPRSTPTRNVRE